MRIFQTLLMAYQNERREENAIDASLATLFAVLLAGYGVLFTIDPDAFTKKDGVFTALCAILSVLFVTAALFFWRSRKVGAAELALQLEKDLKSRDRGSAAWLQTIIREERRGTLREVGASAFLSSLNEYTEYSISLKQGLARFACLLALASGLLALALHMLHLS